MKRLANKLEKNINKLNSLKDDLFFQYMPALDREQLHQALDLLNALYIDVLSKQGDKIK